MIERSVAFGPGEGLVGTLCLPDGPPRAAVGEILFNAGVVHRVGPHRINVRLARRLARRGIPSIRFDLAGQGDSARPDGERTFERQAVADLQAAMDALGAAAGCRRFGIFGFCSGGVHGYEAAQADERVAGLILYDTYIYRTFRSRLNRYLGPIRRRGLASAVGGWIARQPAELATLGRRLAGKGEPAVREEGLFRVPGREEFAQVVRRLHERGVEVGVMYSRGFLAYNYANQFRDAFRGLGIDFVTCDYFDDMGHTATALDAQARLMQRVEDWTVALDRRWRGATA